MDDTSTPVGKPVCQLTGTDGNAFAIIANVDKALKRAGLRERAQEWRAAAFKSASYDALLQLAFEYVEVE
jgi:hypothetical protein